MVNCQGYKETKQSPGSATTEPPHDKTNNVAVCPAKTQISLGIRPVWSESSLSAWRKHGSLATHWAHSEDSDQTRRMPRLIWVFAGHTVTLLVLLCRGSFKDRSSLLQPCGRVAQRETTKHVESWSRPAQRPAPSSPGEVIAMLDKTKHI